jgi:hypothetical protein
MHALADGIGLDGGQADGGQTRNCLFIEPRRTAQPLVRFGWQRVASVASGRHSYRIVLTNTDTAVRQAAAGTSGGVAHRVQITVEGATGRGT